MGLRFPALFLLIILSASCRKSKETTQVPLVSVNFYIYTTDPLYSSLQVNGGYVYYNAGSRGVIIYRKSQDEFRVYDRHCTYNISDPCGKVKVDANVITATDTCCGSSFSLTDGSVLKGPASSPLTSYPSTLEGHRLHVYN